MEKTQRISLYSYLHLKLAKTLFFFLSYIFFLHQNQRTRGQNRFCLMAGKRGVEVAQIMYTRVSKCKNDKIKLKKQKRKEVCYLGCRMKCLLKVANTSNNHSWFV
jgi:hypothetical protein